MTSADKGSEGRCHRNAEIVVYTRTNTVACAVWYRGRVRLRLLSFSFRCIGETNIDCLPRRTNGFVGTRSRRPRTQLMDGVFPGTASFSSAGFTTSTEGACWRAGSHGGNGWGAGRHTRVHVTMLLPRRVFLVTEHCEHLASTPSPASAARVQLETLTGRLCGLRETSPIHRECLEAVSLQAPSDRPGTLPLSPPSVRGGRTMEK